MRNELFRRNSGGLAVLVGTCVTCRSASGRGWVTVTAGWSNATDRLLRSRDENASVGASHANGTVDEQHDMRVSDIGSCEPLLSAQAAAAWTLPGNIDGHVSNPTSTRTMLLAVTEVVMPFRRSDDILCMRNPIP